MLKTKNITFFLPEYAQIKELMRTAFPEYEQISVWFLRLLSLRKGIDFTAYYDEDAFVGMSFTIKTEEMAFLLFLAVNPKIQSKGYGSQILTRIKEENKDVPIALNMEVVDPQADNYEQRLKRLRFYEKNGFYETGYIIEDEENPFSILSDSKKFDEKAFCSIIRKLSFGSVRSSLLKKIG